MDDKPPRITCVAKAKTTGSRCKRSPIPGGTVCIKHGGRAPQVVAKAQVRREVASWGLGDVNIDPGEILLRMLSQSAARAEGYALELERVVGDSESLHKALIGESWGEFGIQGQYIKGLVVLESQERDRCVNFATKAIAAGLAKRQVEIAEFQARMMMAALDAALSAANVLPEQRQLAKLAAVQHLRLTA